VLQREGWQVNHKRWFFPSVVSGQLKICASVRLHTTHMSQGAPVDS
jgi:hypothetical protein